MCSDVQDKYRFHRFFWSDFSRVILDAFSNPDPSKKDNAAGIQMLGIIAANGLSPIASDSTMDEDR